MELIKMYKKYFTYVLRHKFFVFVECLKNGLFWRGLVHDISKFRPSEAKHYANFFSSSREEPTLEIVENFSYAWFLHQKRNKHHWQYWILYEDNGKVSALKMPSKYVLEMVCDWIGAQKALHGRNEVKKWYECNKKKMLLHSATTKEIEKLLNR